MTKGIIIFGSSRSQGNTKDMIDEFNHDNAFDFVDLNSLNITTYDYEHKNQNDDYLPLMEKVLNYNAIILVTPVYWYTMSAQMKIFFDRLTDCLRIRQDIGRALAGKTIYVLTTYAGSMPQGFEDPFWQTAKYMKMNYGGCFYYYAGKDEQLKEGNSKLLEFRRQIG